jgi:hypothetical protein
VEDPRQALFLDDKRNVVLFVYCIAGLSNYFGYNIVQEALYSSYSAEELSTFIFAFFHQIHSFSFFVLYLPSAYLIETYGIKKTITGAMFMTSIGLWLCYFKVTIAASILLGTSMPVFLISVTKMSATWFGP